MLLTLFKGNVQGFIIQCRVFFGIINSIKKMINKKLDVFNLVAKINSPPLLQSAVVLSISSIVLVNFYCLACICHLRAFHRAVRLKPFYFPLRTRLLPTGSQG